MAASESWTVRTPGTGKGGLKAKIKEACGNKRGDLNKWVVQAFRNALKVDDPEKGTVAQQALKGETERRFDQMLDDQLLTAMENNKNLIKGLSDTEIAKLIAQRAPKAKGGDENLEKSALSLEKSLGLMPKIEDITGELSKAKQKIFKLESEMEINAKITQTLRAKLKKDDPGAWALFQEACRIMQERCNRNDHDSGVRMLESEDIRALILK